MGGPLDPRPANLELWFDMEKSGGSMAWDHFGAEADLRKLGYSEADVAKAAESFRSVNPPLVF